MTWDLQQLEVEICLCTMGSRKNGSEWDLGGISDAGVEEIIDGNVPDDFFEHFLEDSLGVSMYNSQSTDRLKRSSYSTGDLPSLGAGAWEEKGGSWSKLPTLDEMSPGPKQEISEELPLFGGGNFHMSIEEMETNLIPSLGQPGSSHSNPGFVPSNFQTFPSSAPNSGAQFPGKPPVFMNPGQTGANAGPGLEFFPVIPGGIKGKGGAAAGKVSAAPPGGTGQALSGKGGVGKLHGSVGSSKGAATMRRVQSAGDLGAHAAADGNIRIGKLTLEERRQKIQRYREKRYARKYEKKVQYNCRKTLADSRPRVRGRFAKNDDTRAKLPEQEKVDAAAKQKAEVAMHRSSKKGQKPFTKVGEVEQIAGFSAGTMVS